MIQLNEYAIEILIGFILVPYFSWITMSIFNLKQAQAVMKMEISLIKDIREYIRREK